MTITQSVVSDNLGTLGASLGGILNIGILPIRDSVISNNGGEDVGGVLNEGTLKIRNTAFVGNVSVANHGGGIHNRGTLEIVDSTFSRNRAPDGLGGGIQNSGFLTVKRSLFAENRGDHSGGGISNGGTANVDQCTFFQNLGGFFGFGGGGSTTAAYSPSRTVHFRAMLLPGAAVSSPQVRWLSRTASSRTTRRPLVVVFSALTLKNTIVTDNTPDDIFP